MDNRELQSRPGQLIKVQNPKIQFKLGNGEWRMDRVYLAAPGLIMHPDSWTTYPTQQWRMENHPAARGDLCFFDYY